MPRRQRPTTLVDIHNIDRAATLIRDAANFLREAGAHRAALRVRLTLKSIDGARRHACLRLYRTTREHQP